MKQLRRKVLIVLLVCGMFGCADNASKPAEERHCAELSFGEPSLSGMHASLEILRAGELLYRIGNGELSGERAKSAYDVYTDALKTMETDAALAYIRYSRDVTDEANRNRYSELYVQVYALRCILIDAALRLSRDPALSAFFDETAVERLEREDALSDLSVLPLIERERALISAYEMLPATLTIEFFGRTWTGDGILSDK